MLTVSPGAKVYLAVATVDLRRGHDGLCALVHGALGLDPYGGHFFVFVGKRGDRIKILFGIAGASSSTTNGLPGVDSNSPD